MIYRVVYAIAIVVGVGEIASSKETPERTLGISVEKPAEGISVKIAEGFMVPYSATIPGTNVRFQMVPIPGGEITLTLPKGNPDERTGETFEIDVIIPPFWISKYEVTWGEYQVFLQLCDVFEKFDDKQIRQITPENSLDAVTGPSKIYDPSFTYDSGEDPELPAVSMSQYAAKQYTKWLSLLTESFYRLPTEAEWEYACRAGRSSDFSFGDDITQLSDYAWHAGNSDESSHPVGEKIPNAWGLFDMHGNVSEWVLDAYYAEPDQLQNGVTSEQAVVWPRELYPRVLRGGSWQLDGAECQSNSRRPSDDDQWRIYDPNVPQSPWWFASEDAQDVGFRIVRPLAVPGRGERNKFWDADIEEIQRVVDLRIDQEGRGRRGIVDPELPGAIEKLGSDDSAHEP